jgi:hypothetical protein
MIALMFENFYFYFGHWMFAFRYFEVAEMLGRADKSYEAHIRARKITGRISVAVIIIMAATSIAYITN